MKWVQTTSMSLYLAKFLVRLGIFSGVLAAYLIHKDVLYAFMTHRFTFGLTDYGISLLHVLWAVFMFMMLRHLFPTELITMALRKQQKVNFRPAKDYDELQLLRYVQRQNQAAWKVLLVWLLFNAVWGLCICSTSSMRQTC